MVRVLTVQGAIRPASADYLLRGLAGAAADKAHPVTIYVSPKGARTASAGTCIRWLSELRGRNADRVERAVREAASLSASEALKLKAIDLMAIDLDDMLAERERRAKAIHAQCELQASEKRLATAESLAGRPQAMRLRYPQTLSNIAGDRSNTIVFPIPDELINLTMRGGKSGD